MKPVKALTMKVLMFVSNFILIPAVRWCMPPEMRGAAAIPSTRIASNAAIDLLIFNAAFDEHNASPEYCQPTLNACLDALHTERIGDSFVRAFGGMVGQGRNPDEALRHVCSNAICIGMHLQRRLLS